jgi:hypothetical protein
VDPVPDPLLLSLSLLSYCKQPCSLHILLRAARLMIVVSTYIFIPWLLRSANPSHTLGHISFILYRLLFFSFFFTLSHHKVFLASSSHLSLDLPRSFYLLDEFGRKDSLQ